MRRCAIAVALIAGAAASAAASPPRPDDVFTADGAPPIHARVRYVDARGAEHRLELWRTAQTLRRDTDGKLSIVVERRAGGDDEYHVVDRTSGRAYDASRAVLYRIGSFPSWPELATLAPAARHAVRIDRAGADERMPAGRCRWYRTRGGPTNERICWSSSLRLALAVEREAQGSWTRVVTVESVLPERTPPPRLPTSATASRVDLDRDLD